MGPPLGPPHYPSRGPGSLATGLFANVSQLTANASSPLSSCSNNSPGMQIVNLNLYNKPVTIYNKFLAYLVINNSISGLDFLAAEPNHEQDSEINRKTVSLTPII